MKVNHFLFSQTWFNVLKTYLQSYGVVLLIFQVLKGARLPVVVGMSGGLWLVNVGRQSMDCANGERGSAGFDSGL